MNFTEEETVALVRYQDNDYVVINSLLRRGCSSEIEIDKRKNKEYPFLTKEVMDEYLSCITCMYSAILRTYQANGCLPPDKALYRGTQIDIIEAMDGEACSFLSTTTSYVQTRPFSILHNKDGRDDSKRAVAFIEGNVPWINIDDIVGGMEEEITFVPAMVHVEPIESGVDTRLGKAYKMTLTELDIPEKSPEEINEMKTTILNQTETMSSYLRLILEDKRKPGSIDSKTVEFATLEYNKWKDLVIDYSHQQYRVLRNQIINSVEDKKNISSK